MKNHNIGRIIEAVSTRQVMEHYGIDFNKRGFAICPFHEEKTASLTIKNDHYKCFGCGAYGGSIDFVMKYFGLSLPQAILKIGKDFGIPIAGYRPTYRDRLQESEDRRINEAKKKFDQEIKENYDALCDVHRVLYRTYVETGSDNLKRITEGLAEILDDFSGEEARNWEMRLFRKTH